MDRWIKNRVNRAVCVGKLFLVEVWKMNGVKQKMNGAKQNYLN